MTKKETKKKLKALKGYTLVELEKMGISQKNENLVDKNDDFYHDYRQNHPKAEK